MYHSESNCYGFLVFSLNFACREVGNNKFFKFLLDPCCVDFLCHSDEKRCWTISETTKVQNKSVIIHEVNVEMVFCYQNCSDLLLWEKIVLVIEKNFWNSRLKVENLKKKLRSLEQFIQTVKGQNNSWNRMLF